MRNPSRQAPWGAPFGAALFSLFLSVPVLLSAQPFGGPYAGIKIGANVSDSENTDAETGLTLGAQAGYDRVGRLNLLLGWLLFADYNMKTDHPIEGTAAEADFGSAVYGIDGKIGYVFRQSQYYGKLGFAGMTGTGDADGSDIGIHGGIGVVTKVRDEWGIALEWLYSSADAGPADDELTNSNFTVGVNYYFEHTPFGANGAEPLTY